MANDTTKKVSVTVKIKLTEQLKLLI